MSPTDIEFNDRQWREPTAHVQRPLEPICCATHGLWMPRHIADGDCPDCYHGMCDSFAFDFEE